MSYQLEIVEIEGVTVALRPRSLLTDEIQRSLRMDCLMALSATDSDDVLVVQPILDTFGIEENDLLYMTAYLWILSARVATIEGADFEFIKRSDTAESILAKIEHFMASNQTEVVKAIDEALTELDKPFDAELAPNPNGLTEKQKKTGKKSKRASTTG